MRAWMRLSVFSSWSRMQRRRASSPRARWSARVPSPTTTRRGLRVPHGSAARGAGGAGRGEDAVPRASATRVQIEMRDDAGRDDLRRDRTGGRAVRRPPPPMTGETAHGLRGDYSRMRPDYTVDQDWDAYRPRSTTVARASTRRQLALVPKLRLRRVLRHARTLDFDERHPALRRHQPQARRPPRAGSSSPCPGCFPTSRSSSISPTAASR